MFHFRDAPAFATETLAVTGGALAVGLLAGVAAPLLALPMATLAGGAALVGGSMGAALTRPRPKRKALRAVLGAAGGVLAACGFLALTQVLGLSSLGAALGGWLGGLALGLVLGVENKLRPGPRIAGLLASSTTGAIGALALVRIAEFAASEAAPIAVTAATMAGALGLWIAAASGLRRFEKVRDPLADKAEQVLLGLVDPVRTKVTDGLQTSEEIELGLHKDEHMASDTMQEARRQARLLLESMLETAATWKQIHGELSSPRLRGIEAKLADLDKRAEETNDDVTKGHLLRATQALRAQKTAIDGLKIGCGRAEAALDAQVALLERLRLAVAQHRVSDRERFAVEVSAVADQVVKLSDDLESLGAAIAEAESLADRLTLADLERAGRKALSRLEEAHETVHESVQEKVTVAR